MISLVAFTVLPIVFMVLIAFTNFDSNHQPPGELFTWTGLTNVTDIFLGNQTKTHTFFGIFGWMIVWAILWLVPVFWLVLSSFRAEKSAYTSYLWPKGFF